MPKTTDLNQTAIDPAPPKFRALLENLQRNILRLRRQSHLVESRKPFCSVLLSAAGYNALVPRPSSERPGCSTRHNV